MIGGLVVLVAAVSAAILGYHYTGVWLERKGR